MSTFKFLGIATQQEVAEYFDKSIKDISEVLAKFPEKFENSVKKGIYSLEALEELKSIFKIKKGFKHDKSYI